MNVEEHALLHTFTLIPETDEPIQENQATDTKPQDLPPHAAFLYDLLGSQKAKEILNPVMKNDAELSGKHAVKPARRVVGNLKREISSLSQQVSGANALWKMLREDSKLNMTAIETESYRRLHDAYDSFLRQCIVKRQMPAVMNNMQTKEWDEYQRLLQQDRLSKIYKQRRQKELMFRLAKANVDKQQIISLNNPLPYVMQDEGMHLNRLVPDVYLKDFRRVSISQRPKPMSDLQQLYADYYSKASVERTPSQSTSRAVSQLELSDVIDVENLRQRPSLPAHLARPYLFLEEENLEDLLHRKHEGNTSGSRKSLHLSTTRDSIEKNVREEENELCSERILRKRTPQLQNRGSATWEPLSFAAQMDYTHTRTFLLTRERPDFREGRVPLWRPKESHLFS